jgi:hypothetical protein
MLFLLYQKKTVFFEQFELFLLLLSTKLLFYSFTEYK